MDNILQVSVYSNGHRRHVHGRRTNTLQRHALAKVMFTENNEDKRTQTHKMF